jgi:ATPases with chaperone activity, ATP-binding subunit
MFERYTETARRSLFFARYEASVLGSLAIETHHLLLGLLKEQHPPITHMLGTASVTRDALRQQIYAEVVSGSPLPQSVEIPFSADAKQVLEYTAEEASRLLHRHIGTEHLLLGLLRHERGLAWQILSQSGLRLTTIRDALVMHVSATTAPPPEILKMLAGVVQYKGPHARRTGHVYLLKATDGSHPGRRLVIHDSTTVAYSRSSFVEFNTAGDLPPDGLIQSIGPLSMQGVTLPQFALMLEAFLNEPVIVDEDGSMSEMFDIELNGTYDKADALIPALREQLGLELIRSL